MSKKQIIMIITVVTLAIFLWGVKSESVPGSYSYSISLIEKPRLDSSMTGVMGQGEWYQWMYKVEVVDSDARGFALSNFLLEVKDCYDDNYLAQMTTSAGANRGNLYGPNFSGNELRQYVHDEGVDGTSLIRGTKWEDIIEGSINEEIDEEGDFEYFWFSAPTQQSVTGKAAIKFGGEAVLFDVEIPACPDGGGPVLPM